MIAVTKLNKSKTYVCCEVGTSWISHIIQRMSKKLYKKAIASNIASHVFALRYKNNKWMIWENHLKWGSIKEYPLKDFEMGSSKDILVYEYPLNTDSMDYWLNNNPGYSVVNLFEIAEERLIGLTLPDTKGWVCSQAIAACNFKICNDLKKPFSAIIPADFQFYLTK